MIASSLTAVLLVVAVALAVFGPLYAFDRRQQREENEWKEKQHSEMNAYVAQTLKEARDREALVQKLSDMRWPDVRALCESETGRACECSTKWQAAQNIWWARYRRDQGNQGAASP